MYEILASFEGLAPMMHDRFFNAEEVERGKSKKKAAGTWQEELPRKLHADAKGVFLPADNIRMMLIGNQKRPGAAKILGSYIETGKKGTELTSLCEGCVWVLGLEDSQKVYLKREGKIIKWPQGKEPEPGVDYDERSFPSPNGRHLTRRPIIILPWTMAFKVQVTDDRIDASRVRELFDVAGLRCGAGAYGPTFGRCIITEWEPKTK